ncbi:cell envelope integrity protein CreD [Sneathiella sp. P13V-1]|uniref:cell envelope integrity protein CreD n=1 Tax=Sneathiella sp. P13V-1 TaxID=2697366 RepID=UPI00187BA468|nr:cell envelope integrity protein CreD [Sneathiella sp. P13V-1]MBE7637455.1 cell envelope integrity protein CreD [Sneathiella sp. P13V-1]
MQRALLLKFLVIGGIALLLLIPLMLIGAIIDERAGYRDQVMREIADTWVGAQRISGPILVVPYEQVKFKEVRKIENGKEQRIKEKFVYQKRKYLLPRTLDIKGDIIPQDRYRGIYKVSGYSSDLKMNGAFDLSELKELGDVTWKAPYLVLGVQDVRGINKSISVSVNDQAYSFEPGANLSLLNEGVHAEFPTEILKQKQLSFDIDLVLLGIEKIVFQPLGETTTLQLSSSWPHPSFMGRYLPEFREVSDEGFEAKWETSYFSSNIKQQFQDCALLDKCHPFNSNFLGVSLYQGVDVYVQSDRSIKYAILFVGLTFVAFFLFEILKNLKIHAVQYGLVGVALSLFYLLLISLSEHISFVMAYLIASGACVGLLGFYVCFVLKSLLRGTVFALVLIGLYAALYMLIRSEDYALLMGTFLLFGVLAFIMAITRNIDWYKITADPRKEK